MECSNDFNNSFRQTTNYNNVNTVVNYVPPPYVVNRCVRIINGHNGCNDNSIGCSALLKDQIVYQHEQCNNVLCNNVQSVANNYQKPIMNQRIRPTSLLAKLALPCQTATNYDYDNCYSYYANGCYNTCQFVEFGDIEDFM